MKKVIIVRGIPGSGKSHYVGQCLQKLSINVEHVCSADSFHLFPVKKDDGFTILEYRYAKEKAGQAHSYCLGCFINLLTKGLAPIFVDNTNVHLWEYENYVRIGMMAGYKVEIVQFVPRTPLDVLCCYQRNIHQVPQDIISRMALEFEFDDRATTFHIKTKVTT